MNLITRNTDYAVRALCYIAQRPERVVTVTELCSELAMPRPYLRRVLQVLARRHILSSCRGQGGGFRLRKAPSDIMLTDLMETFQGKIDFTRCTFRASVCRNHRSCPLRMRIKEIEKQAVTELRATSLESLISIRQPVEVSRESSPGRSLKRRAG